MKKGFTLIEVLLVIAFIAILAVVIVLAINPGRQFAKMRNTQRSSDLNTILNAIVQNMTDNKGTFVCNGSSYSITTTYATIAAGIDGADLAPCLVPVYVPKMPVDPQIGNWTSTSSYDTGYLIYQDSGAGRIFLRAPAAELGETIELQR